MWRTLLFLIPIVLGSERASASAWQSAMIYDAAWGANVPLVDPTSGGVTPIGFVRLPLSGGYYFLTAQTIDGWGYVVVTRLREDGSLDTAWLDPASNPYASLGSAIVDAPFPDLDSDSLAKAMVAVDSTGGTEQVFLAEITDNGSALAVMRFDANFANVDVGLAVPAGLRHGFGGLEAITVGANFGGAGLGLAAAVSGNQDESSNVVFFEASGTALSVKALDTRAAAILRINHARTREDGDVEFVGTESGQALYLKIGTSSGAGVVVENRFDLKCPDNSLAAKSAIDVLAASPESAPTENILKGRVDCGPSGYFSVIERSSKLDLPTQTNLESVSVANSETNCTDQFPLTYCNTYLATVADVEGTALAVTSEGSLIHIDAAPGKAMVVGSEVNSDKAGFPQIAPTYRFGAEIQYPYLVALRLDSTGNLGLGRIAIDRIFTDGASDFAP